MAVTLSDFVGSKDTAHTQASNCSCPACTLLQCLERPRFFAGQVINETDLNDQINYLLAKQRLQNRYLHGTGTVCGLEVVCNNCKGFVTVHPGYAISPCGEDILVCQDQPFDVMSAIKACCTARKSTTNCDPYRPSTDPGCTGLEERWCVTIQYLETQTQAITPLRNPRKATRCGCGCDTPAGATSTTRTCGCGASVTTATTPVQCEPTRILEGFQLGIIPDPGTCDSAESLYGDTLFANLVQCVSQLSSFTTQLPKLSLTIVLQAVAGNLAGSGTDVNAAYAACCQLRKFALNLFASNGSITSCAAVSAYQASGCPAPPNQQAGAAANAQYLASVQESIQATVLAIFEAFRECVCHSLLPPCPADPTDDRLILACLTVKDGAIIDICNFGCRTFAGSFPSFFYWLSVVPILPLLKKLVDEFCCSTEKPRQMQPRVAELNVAGRTGTTTTSASSAPSAVQQTFMEGNFALPKQMLQHLGDFAQRFSFQHLEDSVPTNQVNVATLVGMKTQDAARALQSHKVSFEQRSINTRSEIPLSVSAFIPFAASGDHVVLYETDGSVVDAQAAPQIGSAADVADLRTQMAAMRSELDEMKRTATIAKNK
jgi:hypothetical protein